MKLHSLGAMALTALSLILIACGDEASPAATSTPVSPSSPTEAPRIETAATPVAPEATSFRLTILHNNDGESQLVDLGPGLEDFGGVARFATVVQQEKQVAASDEGAAVKSGVILVTSGNNFLAAAEFIAGLRAGTFYDAIALDLIDYDAIALGNHDFDFGPEVLAQFIEQVSTSRAPFLSSNLDFSGEPVLRDLLDEGRIAGSVVVEVNGERIGVIGATTPDLGVISSPRKVEIMSDVAGEVQIEVDRLEASGVNKILLISHLQFLDNDIAMVAQVRGVDVVVAGGGHELLANQGDLLISVDDTPFGSYPIMATDRDGDQVPVVTTEGNYSYLGKLVVTFDADGRLTEVDEDASGPIRIAGGDNSLAVQPDPQVQREVIDRLMEGLDDLAQPIAESQVELDGRRSEVRSVETNQGNLMADALLWQARLLASDYDAAPPDVAVLNGGGIRNDSILSPGPIRELDTFDMAPFANRVTVVEGISRSQFKEILENAVSRAVDGDAEGGTGRFAQVSGFSFEWSESGTAQVLNPDGVVEVPGTRIQGVLLDSGEVIVAEGEVASGPDLAVATFDFLARGGDEYPFRGAPTTALGVTDQHVLANYLQLPTGLDGTVTAA